MVAAAGLALAMVGTAAAFYLTYRTVVVKPNKPVVETDVKPTATPTPDPLAPYSFLLMGYGGGSHEGGLLTDSIMVVRIEPRNRNITMISVPRDLWVSMPISPEATMEAKVNAAYAIGSDDKKYPNKEVQYTGKAGGGEMAKEVIGKVVGFKIDHFAALDFAGFVKTIDLLGGIDVKVSRAFDDPKYPIEENINDTCGKSDEEVAALTATMSGEKLENQFPCRYENLHFDKGTQHMDGVTALKYARSRHSTTDGGDFNRAARQREILLAVKQKVISVGFIPKIVPAIKTLAGNLTTDVDINKMNELLGQAGELSEYTITPAALTDQNVLMNSKSKDGQFILIPRAGDKDWSEIQKFVNNPTMLTPTAIP